MEDGDKDIMSDFDNDTQKIIQKIVDYCRKGNIWGIRDILRSVPESEQRSLLNQYDKFGDTALIAASSNGHVTLMQYLLKIPGVDPNIGTERTQFTPLMLAAANGNKQIVEMLLHMPTINTEIKGINKMTAAEEAIYADHPDVSDMIRTKL